MKRVLIVDDEAHMRELARVTLEVLDATFAEAANGRQALRAARRNPPDLVLLDRLLPDMDGLEVARELRRDPRTTSIPIILVTAREPPDGDLGDRCLPVLAQVVKPFSPRQLLELVEEALRGLPPDLPEDRPRAVSAERSRGPVFEPAALDAWSGSRQHKLREWVWRFLAETAPKVAELQEAVAAGAAGAVERLAHTLKSNSRWLGGRAFSDLCEDLEKAAGRRDLDACRRWLADADKEFLALEAALVEYLGKLADAR